MSLLHNVAFFHPKLKYYQPSRIAKPASCINPPEQIRQQISVQPLKTFKTPPLSLRHLLSLPSFFSSFMGAFDKVLTSFDFVCIKLLASTLYCFSENPIHNISM